MLLGFKFGCLEVKTVLCMNDDVQSTSLSPLLPNSSVNTKVRLRCQIENSLRLKM